VGSHELVHEILEVNLLFDFIMVPEAADERDTPNGEDKVVKGERRGV